MPQLTSFTVEDRESTPVDHVFTPRDIVGGVGTVSESSGIPIGDREVTISLRKTPQNRYRATLKGRFPIVQTQTLNGVSTPVVVRVANIDCTFSFDATSTEQERKNVVGMFQNMLDPSVVLINDTVVKLQGVY
jgi:hypothetical protein